MLLFVSGSVAACEKIGLAQSQAALFSAILTAFIIESKSLLQQDSADVSVSLLLLIARSQQRVEQENPQLSSPFVEVPSFSPPASARLINGLWFTSLALSLSAALVAMLAKEWLTAFTASRPRPAQTHAMLRQARLNGLTQWRALHIIDLLPSMLHLALLLFSIGLTVYLWALDPGTAGVIAIISGGTLLFYIATSVFGAVREFCPFVTQISKYIRIVLDAFPGRRETPTDCLDTNNDHSKDDTTDNHLQALVWLVDNARDPTTGDCSYQALAGLRIPRATALNYSSQSVNHYMLLAPMFDAICERLFDAPVLHPQELASCEGINVARYAAALPKLVGFLETCIERNPKIYAGKKLHELPVRIEVVCRAYHTDTDRPHTTVS